MISDVQAALKNWRIIHLLGLSALRGRFARSKLGQIWLTLSMFINICIVGVVWSFIWHIPIAQYLPYVGIGQVIYLFASQTVNESTSIFISNARLYTNQKFSLSLAVLAHIYRAFIILLYNIPIMLFLFFWFPHGKVNFDIYFPFGVVLTLLFLIFSSHALAILCVRFRDLIQLIGMVMQSVFLLTPVMWSTSVIPERFQKWVYLNPFAAILDIWRTPLIGGNTTEMAYISMLIWTGFFLCAAILLHRKFYKNIVFWM